MANKIFVLMSGGVDSSVAAVLLKEQGHNVIGVHLKISNYCNPQDEYDARAVAEILNIPFYVIDITQEYQKTVALDMIANYAAGYTPNPDVLCNKLIKFGFIYEKLDKLGFDYLTTGHYARLRREIRNTKYEIRKIYVAKDLNKDQTYFLWGIKRSRLKKVLFPIGDYLKSEVRELAQKFNLPNFAKKDSQGICFLGKISLQDYLQNYLPIIQGEVVGSNGRVLGCHPGHYFFTEGQRHGLGLKDGGGPYYVAQKSSENNRLVIAKENEKILYSHAVKLTNLNWIVEQPKKEIELQIRYRYRQPLVKASFNPAANSVKFDLPQKAVAVGQSAVFYLNDQLIGGGVINQKLE